MSVSAPSSVSRSRKGSTSKRRKASGSRSAASKRTTSKRRSTAARSQAFVPPATDADLVLELSTFHRRQREMMAKVISMEARNVQLSKNNAILLQELQEVMRAQSVVQQVLAEAAGESHDAIQALLFAPAEVVDAAMGKNAASLPIADPTPGSTSTTTDPVPVTVSATETGGTNPVALQRSPKLQPASAPSQP
jgi:hypothetical protein